MQLIYIQPEWLSYHWLDGDQWPPGICFSQFCLNVSYRFRFKRHSMLQNPSSFTLRLRLDRFSLMKFQKKQQTDHILHKHGDLVKSEGQGQGSTA